MTRAACRPLIWILAIAAALRALLLFAFPSFLTADSWDYLLAAQDLAASLDFNSHGLRDWRMPGYSLLLAAAKPLTAAHAERILLLQAALGLLAVVLAYYAGVAAQSRLVAIGLSAFVAFNPVYLLFEHTIMSESLAIVTLTAFLAAVAWACGRGRPAWASGALVGASLSLCVLTRSNLLLFCALAALAPPLCWAAANRRQMKPLFGQAARFAAAGALTALLLVGPWIARNVAAYDQPGLLLSINRNLLVYKAMYSPIDTQLPRLQAVSQELGSATVDYDWLWRLIAAYPVREAESVARDLWREQIAAHPAQFAADIAKAAAAMGGFSYWNAGDLTAVAIWLRQYVPDSSLLDANNRQMDGYAGFRYAAALWQGPYPDLVTWAWSRAGLAYLYLLRPLLAVALGAALGRYLWLLAARRLPSPATRDVMLLVLSAAFIASAVLHVATLAVNDRFASTFDLLAVFLLLLAVDILRAARVNVSSVHGPLHPPAT